MPAVITGHSPQPVTEKLDDSLATPYNVAKVSRTNGNMRRGSDKDEGDADTQEEPSLKYERMGDAASMIHSSALAGFGQQLEVFGMFGNCQLVYWTSLWS